RARFGGPRVTCAEVMPIPEMGGGRRPRSAHGTPIARACPRLAGAAFAMDNRPDRKSTRLNSSHLVISYAVFFLKKKNISWFGSPGKPRPSSCQTATLLLLRVTRQ